MPFLTGIDGEMIVTFGSGDIAVCLAKHDGEPCNSELVFIPGPAGRVGRESNEGVGKKTNELGCRLRFQFANNESLVVVIEELQKLLHGRQAAMPKPTVEELQQEQQAHN